LVKILIVDDEVIERMALQKIIETEVEDVEVVGQAENGRRAIELASELQPDLILMDIKMPGIDGLQAIERIGETSLNPTYIIVSSFDTFEYARQALRLGVKDYLLKPSEKAVIVSTIKKVIGEIKQERMEVENQKRVLHQLQMVLPIVEADLVTQLLFDHVHEVHLDESKHFLGIEKLDKSFVMVVFVLPKNREAGSRPNVERLYRDLKEKFHQAGKGWVGALSGRQVPIAIFLEEKKGSYRLQASMIAKSITQLSSKYHDINLFVGIGNESSSTDQLRHSYHEALLASVDVTLPGKYHFYEDLSKEDEEGTPFLLDIEKQIIEEVRKGDWLEINYLLEQVIGYYQQCQKNTLEAQQRVYEVFLLMLRVLEDMGFVLDKPFFSFQTSNYQQLRTDATCQLDKLVKSFSRMKEEIETDVASQVKTYILQFSHKEISLEMIADHVQLSPYYVSKLFKEEFGISYIDFLTNCRTAKAKELMAEGKLSLKEITYKIGYRDPNYFSRVFKKACGVSPTTYKKQLVNKNKTSS
jgi:two-component system response regulator YesN